MSVEHELNMESNIDSVFGVCFDVKVHNLFKTASESKVIFIHINRSQPYHFFQWALMQLGFFSPI